MIIKETAHYKLVNEGNNNKIYLKPDYVNLDEECLIEEFTDSSFKASLRLLEKERTHF